MLQRTAAFPSVSPGSSSAVFYSRTARRGLACGKRLCARVMTRASNGEEKESVNWDQAWATFKRNNIKMPEVESRVTTEAPR